MYILKCSLLGNIKTLPVCPGQFGSMVKASAHRLKGLKLDSWSRARTSIAGSIPGPN